MRDKNESLFIRVFFRIKPHQTESSALSLSPLIYLHALYIPSSTNEFGLTMPIILLFSMTGALTRL